jgi:hypothetical protein
MLLFAAGAIPVLMGIVWTNQFPSSDAHVIAPLVVGFFFLVLFALWESFGKAAHPLTPTCMFTSSKGRDLTAPCIALAVVNMFYYSSSILWPTMIAVFYTEGGTNWRYGIVLSIVQGLAITTGAILLSFFGSKIRRWHWQLTGSVFFMVVFGVLLALGKPTNKGPNRLRLGHLPLHRHLPNGRRAQRPRPQRRHLGRLPLRCWHYRRVSLYHHPDQHGHEVDITVRAFRRRSSRSLRWEDPRAPRRYKHAHLRERLPRCGRCCGW